MHVEAHQSADELWQLAKAQKQARARVRLQAVALAREGRTAPQVAAALGVARRAAQEWVARYNRGGVDGLREGAHTGKPPRLAKERHDQLRARLDAGALPSDGVCTLRAADVRRILEAEFGVAYSLKGVYKLLHRLGYSSLQPRPRHKLTDAAAQEAFKKVPRASSTGCARRTRTSGSRSSSRTRPGSASRAR
jgi:transposase